MAPLDVVIVGAPRSGTNMLRDVLTSLPGVATWPCDEINLVWRHGNRSEPSDQLTVEQARPSVAAYVRTQFERVRARYDAPVVVEFVVNKDAMVWPMVAAGTSNDDIKVARDMAPKWEDEEL